MAAIVDFREVLRDSPKFREILHQNESNVDDLEARIERLTKTCTQMVEHGRVFNNSLKQFFTALTDIASHFKEDALFKGWLSEMDKVGQDLFQFGNIFFDHGERSFVKNLNNFVNTDIKSLRDSRTCFMKLSEEMDTCLQRHGQVSKSKQHEIDEVTNLLTARRSCFQYNAVDYVTQISKLQQAKKHKVMEALVAEMQAMLTYHSQAVRAFSMPEKSFEEISDHLTDCSNKFDRYQVSLAGDVEDHYRMVSNGDDLFSPMVCDGDRLEGYLFKRTSNAFKTWNRRWFVLDKGALFYKKRDGDRKDTIMEQDLRLCTVKMIHDAERRFCFEVVSPFKTHTLQADSDSACRKWVDALLSGIDNAHHTNAHETIRNKPKALCSLINFQGNNLCCDCGAPDPQWASINLGITLCIECSGIHRSLGVHISKVRSLTLDSWEVETAKIVERLGNISVNKIYEAKVTSDTLRCKPTASRTEREEWIKSKYVEKKFVKSLEELKAGFKRWTVSRAGYKCSDDSVLVFGDDLNRNSCSDKINEAQELPTYDMSELNASHLLYRAASCDNLITVRHALSLGADVNYRHEEDHLRSSLHRAILDGASISVCEFLLLNGGQHTCVDLEGKTPLHLASQLSRTQLVCLLLRKGADKDAMDKEGNSALALALANGSADIVTLIRLAKFRDDLKLEDSDFAAAGDDEFEQVVRDFTNKASENGITNESNQILDMA